MRGLQSYLLHALRAPLRVPSRAETSEYRPDIDGLRAVAIISVVGFHVGLPGFGGGFVGVDVFFVISGFVITTLLLTQIKTTGSIDLVEFVARRARRLLPAFFLVVATTLILGFLFLVPINGEQQGLASSAMAAALYISNLHFGWSGGGYFDPDAALSPLLHTWSLAVEEQFYLLWPLILLGAAWAARRSGSELSWTIAAVLALILVASLSYSWWAVEQGDRTTRLAFFTLRTRAWELGIGAALALVLPAFVRPGNWLGAALAATGIIAVTAAVVNFNAEMPFPGASALLPTFGAAAIIAGVWYAPGGLVAKLLSARPLILIGLLSYSWYLWHWPLLAVARAQALGVADPWRDAAIAIAALALAWLTYGFIEEPIRSRKLGFGWSNLRLLGFVAAGSLILIVTGQALQAHATWLSKTDKFRRIAQAQNDEVWS